MGCCAEGSRARSRRPWPRLGRGAGRWGLCVGRPQSRSFLAVGMDWASRVTTIALEFALPPLLGTLADRGLGTSGPWCTILGAVLGFAVGMMHVLRLAKNPPDA